MSLSDKVQWSTLDKCTIKELVKMSDEYKNKKSDEIYTILLGKCGKNKTKQQCIYDVKLLTSIITDIQTIRQNPPTVPVDEPPPIPKRPVRLVVDTVPDNPVVTQSVFDKCTYKELMTMAKKYEGMTPDEIYTILNKKCGDNKSVPQCREDVKTLRDIIVHFNSLKQNRKSALTTDQLNKLPVKLRARIMQNISPTVPDRSKKSIDFSTNRGIQSKPFNKGPPSRPVGLPTTSVNYKLDKLKNTINSLKQDTFQNGIDPENMKQNVSELKKNIDEYNILFTKSSKDIAKNSPQMLTTYQTLNREFATLKSYFTNYNDILNKAIYLAKVADKLNVKPDDNSIVKDAAYTFKKMFEMNNKLPLRFRIVNYLDRKPLIDLYANDNFIDNSDVKKIVQQYKINTLYT